MRFTVWGLRFASGGRRARHVGCHGCQIDVFMLETSPGNAYSPPGLGAPSAAASGAHGGTSSRRGVGGITSGDDGASARLSEGTHHTAHARGDVPCFRKVLR
jgi:hypothetical protein